MRIFSLIVIVGIAVAAPAWAQAPCVADGFAEWLDTAAMGREDAAGATVASWKANCSCPADDAACLTIPGPDGATRTASPADLSRAASSAAAWVRSTRNFCAGVAAGDGDATAARACWDRRAASMDGISDPLAREILAEPIRRAATALAQDEAELSPGPADSKMRDPSPGSDYVRRTKEQAEKLAVEICAMRIETDQLRERLDNMRRQPMFIRGEQEPRIVSTQNDLRRLTDALERSRERFEMFAGRSFDPGRDCAPAKIPAPK